MERHAGCGHLSLFGLKEAMAWCAVRCRTLDGIHAPECFFWRRSSPTWQDNLGLVQRSLQKLADVVSYRCNFLLNWQLGDALSAMKPHILSCQVKCFLVQRSWEFLLSVPYLGRQVFLYKLKNVCWSASPQELQKHVFCLNSYNLTRYVPHLEGR